MFKTMSILCFIVFATFYKLAESDDDYVLFDIFTLIYKSNSFDDLTRIEKAIETAQNNSKYTRFKQDILLVKKNINTLTSLKISDINKFLKLSSLFNDKLSEITNKNNIILNYGELIKIENDMNVLLKNCDLILYFFTVMRLDAGLVYCPELIEIKEIEDNFIKFEKSFGKNSVYLCDMYLVLNVSQLINKKFQNIIDQREKIFYLAKEYAGKDSRRFFTARVLVMRAFVELDNLTLGDGIFKELLKEENKDYNNASSWTMALYYKTGSYIYFKNNDIRNAIANQELALANMMKIRNTNHQDILNEAIKTRDLLAINKEWIMMRNIEERFKIPPLPKQNGEDK